jgi:uncharacterized protein HemY
MIELGMAEVVRRLLQSADDSGEWSQALLNGVAATLAATEGRHNEALELWSALIEAADSRDLVLAATEARIGAARSASAVGDKDRAAELLTAATESSKALQANLLLDRIEELQTGGTAATGS